MAGRLQTKSQTRVIEVDNSESFDRFAVNGKYGPTVEDGYNKIYMFGQKGSGTISDGPLQNYAELHERCQQDNSLFVDQNFSPDTIELRNVLGKVEWKRPADITKTPQFINGKATRFDVDQGELGDCWFLAAVANLTMNPNLFRHVVPEDQSFTENYSGIFHFRFWQYGRWVDIVVDDQLPTVNNQLVYLRSLNNNDFWSPLLEKAYAKLYGGYKNLIGGQINEAMEDLCGGLSEFHSLTTCPMIYDIMYNSYKRSSFLGGSTKEAQECRSDGLVSNHAYSITNFATVKVNNSDVKLIRMRNPWGNWVEWNGPWSDKSEMWSNLLPNERLKLQDKQADGEFWMAFDDFQSHFAYVDICHLNPISLIEDHKHWHLYVCEENWKHITAGGGIKYKNTFINNVQYFISIEGERDKPNAKYALVIGLMQKNRRVKHADNLPMELNIFRVKSIGQLNSDFFESNTPILNHVELGVRQLTSRIVLPAGNYCIIPSTVEPKKEASYLLRIYSEISVLGFSIKPVRSYGNMTTHPITQMGKGVYKKIHYVSN